MCYFLNLNQHSNSHPHVAAGAAVSFCFNSSEWLLYVYMESFLNSVKKCQIFVAPALFLGCTVIISW